MPLFLRNQSANKNVTWLIIIMHCRYVGTVPKHFSTILAIIGIQALYLRWYFSWFISIFRRTKAATNRRKSTSHISILPGAKPLSPLAHSAHVPVSPLARTPSPGHSERLQVTIVLIRLNSSFPSYKHLTIFSFLYDEFYLFSPFYQNLSKSVCNIVHQNQGSRGASWVTVSGRSSPVMGRPVMRRRASLASCPEVEYVSKAFYECEVITWHYFRWHLIGSNMSRDYLWTNLVRIFDKFGTRMI